MLDVSTKQSQRKNCGGEVKKKKKKKKLMHESKMPKEEYQTLFYF
jgi:hypothetical protein